jgi:hypothetical protein
VAYRLAYNDQISAGPATSSATDAGSGTEEG